MSGKIDREIENYFSIIHDLASGNETWESRPAWIEFATNNVCNLRCIMCSQANELPREEMSDENAARILDDVLPGASVLTPMAISEPFLMNFELILAKCREHDVWLNLITNATALDGKRFRAIADRLYRVVISMDSHVPEVFERIRVRARYEQVARNVRQIVEAAVELRIGLGFNVVLMADNADHLDGFVDWVADLGGDRIPAEIHVLPMLDSGPACEGHFPEDRWSVEEIGGFLDRAVARADARGILLDVEIAPPYLRRSARCEPLLRGVMPDLLLRTLATVQSRHPQYCNQVAHYMKVLPNGDVFPCCRGPESLRMGNAVEQPIEEIWNGEPYRALRRRMLAGDYPEVCRGCEILTLNPNFSD